MGLIERFFGSDPDDSPFEVGETYWNDDFDGFITVTQLDPFRIQYDYLDKSLPVDRGLYESKFESGVIRKEK